MSIIEISLAQAYAIIENAFYPAIIADSDLFIIAKNNAATELKLPLRTGLNMKSRLLYLDYLQITNLKNNCGGIFNLKFGQITKAYVFKFNEYYLMRFSVMTDFLQARTIELIRLNKTRLDLLYNKFTFGDDIDLLNNNISGESDADLAELAAARFKNHANEYIKLVCSKNVYHNGSISYKAAMESLIPALNKAILPIQLITEEDSALFEANIAITLRDFYLLIINAVNIAVRFYKAPKVKISSEHNETMIVISITTDGELPKELSELVNSNKIDAEPYESSTEYPRLDISLCKKLAENYFGQFVIEESISENCQPKTVYSLILPTVSDASTEIILQTKGPLSLDLESIIKIEFANIVGNG